MKSTYLLRMMSTLYQGLLVVDKPGGITSRKAVDQVLRWFPRGTRLGHTGTLDPLATGVLVLCVGAATRLSEYVQCMAKTYQTRLLLGARSDTDDADGAVTPTMGVQPPDQANVLRCLSSFLGTVEQIPPAYSAAKVSGHRAYRLARQGQTVSLRPRSVQIYKLDLLDFHYPHLELQVHCGKGTYIRSLARDLGERLGCGALVETLRRTQVGPFTTSNSVSLDCDASLARARLLPLAAAVADLPRVTLSLEKAQMLCQGQAVSWPRFPSSGIETMVTKLAVFDQNDTFIAVALADAERDLLQPEKVLLNHRTD